MGNKKILWIRKLSCGHERPTNISFIFENYEKPKVGDMCYCRECWEEVKIVSVKKANDEEINELEEMQKEVNKK